MVENLIIVPKEQECSACRIGTIPPPGGDLGIIFIAGLAAGQIPDPRVQQNFAEGFCSKHTQALTMFKSADAGILHFLGYLG